LVFERFTERARRVMVLAQQEAGLLGHAYVGTEHLLLGLIHEGDGVAANLDSREAWRGLFRIDGPAAPVRVSAGR
jgi:ATP-dependent Clp protease ATP-binding subunit ClpA